MKKIANLFFCLMLALAIAIPAAAFAKALDAGVQPTADDQGNVTIPDIPNGKLVGVFVWNDGLGAPEQKLGAKHNFKLNPGEGFNFTWSGAQGTNWQLVTPGTKPGGSLVVDTSWKDAKGIPRCKYLFPGK
jgi:hypothetical protein